MIVRFGRILILTLSLTLAACSVEPATVSMPNVIALATEAATAEVIAQPSAIATEAPQPTTDETNVRAPSATPTETAMPTETPSPSETPTTEPTATPQSTLAPTTSSNLQLINFESAADTGTWYIVNDTVMGGVSTAGGFVDAGVLTFNGDLSLDNNGGFTSIRRDFTSDLSNYAGIQMRVRGDGRSYFLRISDNVDGFEVSHELQFATVAEQWTTVSLPFDQFTPNFRGRTIDRPPLDRSQLRTMSIMLREKTPGFFQLELDWIQAYK